MEANQFMENSYFFDLPSLLRLNRLDIRKIAKNNPLMSVGEYFSLLTKFVDHGGDIPESLQRISDMRTEPNDLQNLALMQIMLKDIGNESFLPVINDIISLGKVSSTKLAADYAKNLICEYTRLYEQINAARNNEIAEKKRELKEKQLLKKVLNLLDHEESVRKLRVLTVDDAPSMVKTISAILEKDYQVFGLTDPAMLEKFLRQITPELFLLDYEMPDINGFDLVPLIRNFEEHKNTPIIFLTSKGTHDHVSEAYALGSCDFIVKPFQADVLLEKVAKHIVRKKLF